jgi:hypothetical protein
MLFFRCFTISLMNSDHLSTIITSMIMVENDKLVDHVDDYIFVQTVHSVYTVFLFIQ